MTLQQNIVLWIVVIFLGFYCSYLTWKLQKLTERVNELSFNLTALAERTCLIAKGLNELRANFNKEGSNENNR